MEQIKNTIEEKASELSNQFIEDLPHTEEKIIEQYQRQISKEISNNAKEVGIQESRRLANLKYGKFWRERLEFKKIFKGSPFGKMSYH